MRIRRGPHDVAIIAFRHLGEIVERAHLLGELLAGADDFIGWPHVVDLRALGAFGLKQAVNSIERDTTVIADDATATIGVRQAGDDGRLAALHDLRRISVENAVIVGFAVFREGLVDQRIGFEASRLEPRLDHAQAAVRKDRPLERRVGLPTDDHFVFAINIARVMGKEIRWRFCVDVEHALLALGFEIRLQLGPDRLRAVG